MISILALALALCALPQNPIDSPEHLKPLVPAPTQTAAAPPNKPQAQPTQQAASSTLGSERRQGSLQSGASQVPDSGVGPRKLDPNQAVPFAHNRTLLKINGVAIRASEINELVAYYRSCQTGIADLQLTAAVNALLPLKVMSAHFKNDLPGMLDQIDAAYAAIVGGEDFAAVVKRYSEDSEAPNAEGRYTFGRGRAVQPFDRLSFSLPLNTLSHPFLSVYGFHLIEVLDYERAAKPADDRSTMRHILIMYPGMIALEKEGKYVRTWIKEQVKAAKIEVVEAGMENLVPAAYRKQIVRD